MNGYRKADAGIIREIIQQGNVDEAIKNASELAEMYRNAGMTVDRDVEQMNPFTNVHELIEQFMVEIS